MQAPLCGRDSEPRLQLNSNLREKRPPPPVAQATSECPIARRKYPEPKVPRQLIVLTVLNQKQVFFTLECLRSFAHEQLSSRAM
jgi:hypothetical protein